MARSRLPWGGHGPKSRNRNHLHFGIRSAINAVSRSASGLAAAPHAAKGYFLGIQLEIAYAQECADAYVTDVNADRYVWAPNHRTITEFTRVDVPQAAAEDE
jgi:hypothetical protein